MKIAVACGCCALVAWLGGMNVLPQNARAEDGKTRQTAEKAEVKTASGNATVNYLLYLPKDYEQEKTKRYPLVLFLHGAGERGSELQKVGKHGPPKLAETKDFPCIIASPQCPANERWDAAALSQLLDQLESKLRVDKDRIYVTGLSMGGAGAWTLIAAEPQRFAAAAPICGVGAVSSAGSIKHLPIWVFHGTDDKAVPYSASESMVAALKAAGSQVKFTTYPGVGHDSWTATYDNPEFWTWLLAQQKTSN